MRDDPRPASWFRSAEGRRYFLALGAIVAVKIALLLALYYSLIAPQPRVERSPEAVRRRLISPSNDSAKDTDHGR